MGGLSGIFKGFKKLFKKVGKGIKKAVKKVGRFVGKLGIVGQVGMMFLMPHMGNMIWKGLLKMAPGALASTPSLAGTKFGMAGLQKLGAAMTGEGANIAQRLIGNTVKGIHAAASGAGEIWNTITQPIRSAADRLFNKAEEAYGKGNARNIMLTDDKELGQLRWKAPSEGGSAKIRAGLEGRLDARIRDLPEQVPAYLKGPYSPERSTMPNVFRTIDGQEIYGELPSPKEFDSLKRTTTSTPATSTATTSTAAASPETMGSKLISSAKAGVLDAARDTARGIFGPDNNTDYGSSREVVGAFYSNTPNVSIQNDMLAKNSGFPIGTNNYQQGMTQLFSEDPWYNIMSRGMIPSAQASEFSLVS